MVNNFKQIAEMLNFESEDDFYYLQILKRKKEHPELGRNSQVIRTYYIRSVEAFWNYAPEIILLCDYHNARAYFNLNKRSFEKTSFHTLKKVTDLILNKEYTQVKRAFESVCGSHSNEKNKKWILDFDVQFTDPVEKGTFLAKVNSVISKCAPLDDDTKIITVIPSKNGFHLITKPFNIQDFKIYGPDIEVEIHKDNPTLLYCV